MLTISWGTVAEAEDFVEIKRWADRKLDVLRRLLPFKHGVPSHDILNDVMNALPSALFSECFAALVANLQDGDADIIAIDGKTSRRARDGEASRLQTVSAWASRQRLVLGQVGVASHSNEITAIPILMQRFEIKGGLVTPLSSVVKAGGCRRGPAGRVSPARR